MGIVFASRTVLSFRDYYSCFIVWPNKSFHNYRRLANDVIFMTDSVIFSSYTGLTAKRFRSDFRYFAVHNRKKIRVSNFQSVQIQSF